MASFQNFRHLVVTPSRDEYEFLPELINSILQQTMIPSQWVIVSHNSSQRTKDMLSKISKKYNWISNICVDDSSERKRGGQIARIVNMGLSNADTEWDFFSKIDADMVLPEDYFERIIAEFRKSERLGIASGYCYLIENDKKRLEKVSPDHTRGGLKTYRKRCFDEIGGIREVDGWDGIDNIMAQMNNWETSSFTNIEVMHQRRTGSHYGLVSGCFESGLFAHKMGYFPPFMILRCIHRMASKPYLFGGISMLMGYLYSILNRSQQVSEPDVAKHLQNKQKARMSPWRR